MSNNKILDFASIILALTDFWKQNGCSFIASYDAEMGAGTFHPATVIRALDDKPWNVAYIQPSRRPTDGRYGESPNRLQHYYQFQVLMKPSPENIKTLYLDSLRYLEIDFSLHDIRFVEDDWESPTLGAWGRGWEVWLDGMEVTQFTYFQQVGGIQCKEISVEITYGIERIAMYILGHDNIYDIPWDIKTSTTYGDIYLQSEKEFCDYNFNYADINNLKVQFEMYFKESLFLSEKLLPYPAYHMAMKASHVFNLIDSRGAIGSNDRAFYINKVREVVKKACESYLAKQK